MERTALMELAATPKGSLGVGQDGMSMICDEGFNTAGGTAACRARWGYAGTGCERRSAAVTRVSVGQAVVVPCDCVRDETDVLLLLLCFCFCFRFCCCCLGLSSAAAAPAAAAAAAVAAARFSQSPHLQVQSKSLCTPCAGAARPYEGEPLVSIQRWLSAPCPTRDALLAKCGCRWQ